MEKSKPRIVFLTLYDMICVGTRLLSAVAKENGVEAILLVFKNHESRAIIKDSEEYETYQFYIDGIKHGSCYAAHPYTVKELDLLVGLLVDLRPNVLALSTRSFGLKTSQEIIMRFRKTCREVGIIVPPIVAGGWGPTLEAKKFLEFCDYVCFGEGEKIIVEICELLKNGQNDFSDVSNIIFRKENGYQHNSVIEPVTDEELDALPFPDYYTDNKILIDRNALLTGEKFQNPLIYNCCSTRGCPLNCTYCMSSKYKQMYAEHGIPVKKYRVRRVETVIRELEDAKRGGAKFIKFNDEVFPFKKQWIESFFEQYARKIDLPFFAYLRPEFHKPDIIKKMADLGLCSTAVGIQSGSERIRKDVFKRMTPDDVTIEFAKTLSELNIEYLYHLINYNPFEVEQDMVDTLELLYQLPFSILVLLKLVPFPGSPIDKMIKNAKVVALPDKTQKWYGYLYAMALKGAVYRSMSKVILKNGWLKKHLFVFAMLFIPSFLGVHFKKFVRGRVFGAKTLLPLSKKSVGESNE